MGEGRHPPAPLRRLQEAQEQRSALLLCELPLSRFCSSASFLSCPAQLPSSGCAGCAALWPLGLLLGCLAGPVAARPAPDELCCRCAWRACCCAACAWRACCCAAWASRAFAAQLGARLLACGLARSPGLASLLLLGLAGLLLRRLGFASFLPLGLAGLLLRRLGFASLLLLGLTGLLLRGSGPREPSAVQLGGPAAARPGGSCCCAAWASRAFCCSAWRVCCSACCCAGPWILVCEGELTRGWSPARPLVAGFERRLQAAVRAPRPCRAADPSRARRRSQLSTGAPQAAEASRLAAALAAPGRASRSCAAAVGGASGWRPRCWPLPRSALRRLWRRAGLRDLRRRSASGGPCGRRARRTSRRRCRGAASASVLAGAVLAGSVSRRGVDLGWATTLTFGAGAAGAA